MFRANLTSRGAPLSTKAAAVRKFDRMLKGLTEEARLHIQQPALQELQVMPGPVARPIQWTSERQRIFVILRMKREGRTSYPRSGRTARGWRVVTIFTPGEGTITIYNNEPKARFIYGSLARGNTFQQRYHRNTGWVTALPVVERYLNEAAAYIDEGYTEALERYGVLDQRVGI